MTKICNSCNITYPDRFNNCGYCGSRLENYSGGSRFRDLSHYNNYLITEIRDNIQQQNREERVKFIMSLGVSYGILGITLLITSLTIVAPYLEFGRFISIVEFLVWFSLSIMGLALFFVLTARQIDRVLDRISNWFQCWRRPRTNQR